MINCGKKLVVKSTVRYRFKGEKKRSFGKTGLSVLLLNEFTSYWQRKTFHSVCNRLSCSCDSPGHS